MNWAKVGVNTSSLTALRGSSAARALLCAPHYLTLQALALRGPRRLVLRCSGLGRRGLGLCGRRRHRSGSGSVGELFGATDARASPARLALVVAGTDADGLFAALRFAAPVIPPMVRSPFSNLFPDVLVLGPRVLRDGYGGVLLAGYFDARWELDEVASWAA